MDKGRVYDHFRIPELLRLSRLIMVGVGIPVIAFWSISDYQQWGFQSWWMIIRGTFPLVVLFLVYLSSQSFFNHPLRSSWIFGAFSLYILTYCLFFISWSGGWDSRYLLGMPQLSLALALLPMTWRQFLFFFSVCVILPVIVATGSYDPSILLLDARGQLYLTYSLFSVMTYMMLDYTRKQAYLAKTLLIEEKENQSRVIEEQTKELSEAQVAVALAQTTQMFAHDARRPFSLLRAGLDILRKASDGEVHELRAAIDKVEKATQHGLESIDGLLIDILDLGSPSKVNIEIVSLGDLISDSLATVFMLSSSEGIRIENQIEGSAAVWADRNQLKRVLVNLIQNAVLAMPKGGVLSFRKEGFGDRTKVYVSNSGSYIPPERITKIFDSFETGRKDGRGLGLAIVKKILRDHGTSVHCVSSREEGTVFSFELRRAPSVLEGKGGQTPSILERSSIPTIPSDLDERESTFQNKKGKKKILIIDDEEIFRGSAKSLLLDADLSLEIDIAGNSLRALEFIGMHTYDVILIDYDLCEKTTGVDLARSIGQPNAKKVLLTNRFLEADFLIKSKDIDLAIQKPLTTPKIQKILDLCISKENLPLALIVDDSPLFIESWRCKLRNFEVKGFSSPSELLAWLELSPTPKEGSFFVIDYYFGGDQINGMQLAGILQSKMSLPILLSSNSKALAGSEYIDRYIEKKALSDSEIFNLSDSIDQKRGRHECRTGKAR